MNTLLAEKLKSLPNAPGVYFNKDAQGKIIYVGKAAVLKNRVRQYFQKSGNRDPKTELLVSEIADTDWQVVESEFEALFLESELIRRYMPKYNILLRDDKSQSYVRIDFKNTYPSVTITRRPLDDGATYYGPYLSAIALRRALKYLRKIFPYSTHTVLPKRACLLVHLHLCPGPETGTLDPKFYTQSLKKLGRVLNGQRAALISEIEKSMSRASAEKDFEKAAQFRDQVRSLKELDKRILFSDKEFMDLSKDHALTELSELLQLPKAPRRIEGYDISHMSGTDVVASMVVFTNGVADKSQYRKFKSRIPGNDDFEHMREVMRRRFSEANIKKWGKPDFLLIDGGKGQLRAALSVLEEKDIRIPAVGIAKKYEEIVIKKDWDAVQIDSTVAKKLRAFIRETADFQVVDVPNTSHVVKLLQRIRDESHRFAVSYHSNLKVKRQTASMLDDVPGIGPITRKKLIRTFGSIKGVTQARYDELEKILGPKQATILAQYIRAEKRSLKSL